MLEWLRHSRKASDRKLRLFAVASCRLCYENDLQYSAAGQAAVDVAERYADGSASGEELTHAAEAASESGWNSTDAVFGFTRASEADYTAARVAGQSTADAAQAVSLAKYELGYAEMTAAQAALLRDLFGTLPFRAIRIDPVWLTWNDGTVTKLAEAAYEHRSLPAGTLDQARLAVLADALEEAGCTDAALLAHLRSPGPHVRGCFALDAVLVKS
jgi:hypothetical protein